MSLPYLSLGNSYLVPIMPLRLSGAVLVQRTFRALADLGSQDLITVAVPASVLPPLRQAIRHLPLLSEVQVHLAGTEVRAIFPVTPADGLIEAIRLADERGVPVAGLGCEPDQWLMTAHPCHPDPTWPDDGLAVQLGVARYLELVANRLQQSPPRTEPVESWRELILARALRQLRQEQRRVVLVCPAVHVQPLCRLLQSDAPLPGLPQQSAARVRFTQVRPSLQVQLHYLDDMPRLVQRYQEQRCAQGWAFDKRTAVLAELHRLEEAGPDLRFSVRTYQALAQFLGNLLEHTDRAWPRLQEVLEACSGCFHSAFTARACQHLLGYFDHLDGRQFRLLPPEEQRAVSEPDQRRQHSCNPFPCPVQVERAPQPHLGVSQRYLGWVRWTLHVNQMRQKVNAIAARHRPDHRTTVFRGSLERGLAIRRTLRSCWSPQPALHVRLGRRQPSVPVDPHSPIVWLFDLTNRPGYSFLDMFNSCKGGLRLTDFLAYLGPVTTLERLPEGKALVDHRRLLGAVSIIPFGMITDLEREYGPALPERAPRADRMSPGPRGWLPPGAHEYVQAGLPWWDILILVAVEYARANVVVAAPRGFQLSSAVRALAQARQKTVICLSALDVFSAAELDKLANLYTVALPEALDRTGLDSHHPTLRQGLLDFYEKEYPIMQRYWSD